MPVPISHHLSPAPILDALERYAGRLIDLDRKRTVSGGELRSARERLSESLIDAGLDTGDRVLLCAGNGPAFFAAFVGVLACGASPLLLHRDTPPPELLRFACTFGARRILAERWSPAELRDVFPAVRDVACADWCQLRLAAVDETRPDFQGDFPAPAGVPLHPTSGTTGRPKMALRPAEAALAEARHYAEAMSITAGDCLLCTIPMSHAYGFGTCVSVPLLTGADVVSLRQFNPRNVLRALSEFPVTTFPAVPAMLDLLLTMAKNDDGCCPRRVLSAGAPLPERTATAFFERTGNAVAPLYGTTETGGISVASGLSAPLPAACVGPPMNGVRVEVRPCAESGGLDERLGRVYVNSPSMMAGYLGRSGIDASSVEDGWFQTGDLGYLDERGAIHLVGREKDVINVFGLKVVPSEVEDVITAFPGVVDVKVYAGEHRSGSEIVQAAVAGPESLDLTALREYCERELAPFKRPTRFHRLEQLPRSALGKILREELP